MSDVGGAEDAVHPLHHLGSGDHVTLHAGGERTVEGEHDERGEHEDGAEGGIRASAWSLPGWTNWGRKARKKMVSFGFNTLIRSAVRITRQLECGRASCSTVSGVVSHQVCQARKRRSTVE